MLSVDDVASEKFKEAVVEAGERCAPADPPFVVTSLRCWSKCYPCGLQDPCSHDGCADVVISLAEGHVVETRQALESLLDSDFDTRKT